MSWHAQAQPLLRWNSASSLASRRCGQRMGQRGHFAARRQSARGADKFVAATSPPSAKINVRCC